MDSYKEMYYRLFNKVTDVINELQTVQQETEELFLSQKPEQKISKLPTNEKNTD